MKYSFLIFSFALVVFGCKPEAPGNKVVDNVDRQSILTQWADQIIIPGYTKFVSVAEALSSAALQFEATPDQASLDALRLSWQEAYLSWQTVSMFEIGPAESLRLRNNLNIYPVNVAELTDNISQGGYNLELPSQIDRQGFPALDYLLNGLGNTDEEMLPFYTSDGNATARLQYLVDLTSRIESLSRTVLADWTTSYRDEYVSNDGSNANASLDQTVNAILFYYEKFLRAGKVGIPAGVFSGTALPDLVEAKYAGDMSRELLLASLDAFQAFFNGEGIGSATEGPGLSAYLDELDSRRGDQLLSTAINQQFNLTRAKILDLDENIASDIENDLTKVLSVYDELQKNIVLMKVDMMQALSVNISYVDADGD